MKNEEKKTATSAGQLQQSEHKSWPRRKKKEKVRAAVRLGLQTQIDRHHKSI